jgi:hypothetical protein
MHTLISLLPTSIQAPSNFIVHGFPGRREKSQFPHIIAILKVLNDIQQVFIPEIFDEGVNWGISAILPIRTPGLGLSEL